MKIVIAPDSFKGSLSAVQVARAIERGVKRACPDAETRLFPMADGGEGTVDALLFARDGARLIAKVHGATGERVDAQYGVLASDSGPIGIIEAAQVVGLPMARGSDAAYRSSAGVGELLKHCLSEGLRRFMIGVGGSSTNDGGAGLLMALGARLLDGAGRTIPPHPAGLAMLDRIDCDDMDERLAHCDIVLMTDVDNPLCGPQGATATFGPQKGVAEQDIAVFDARIARLARLCDAWKEEAVSQQPGAGAAGGLGYAFMLLGARRRPGAEVICEAMTFDAGLAGADWVVSGEGRSDAQTLHGKLPMVVARHAKRAGARVALLSGSITEESRAALSREFDVTLTLVSEAVTPETAMQDGEHWLALRAEAWLRGQC